MTWFAMGCKHFEAEEGASRMGGEFQIDLRAKVNTGCKSCTADIKDARKRNNGTCPVVVAQLDRRAVRCVGGLEKQ
jgi:hypothetical protein